MGTIKLYPALTWKLQDNPLGLEAQCSKQKLMLDWQLEVTWKTDAGI